MKVYSSLPYQSKCQSSAGRNHSTIQLAKKTGYRGISALDALQPLDIPPTGRRCPDNDTLQTQGRVSKASIKGRSRRGQEEEDKAAWWILRGAAIDGALAVLVYRVRGGRNI